jgi:hypothetical protein
MHASRVALVIASVVGMICTFLPWATAPFVGAVYGTRGDGWISLVLCAGAGVFALVGNRRAALRTAALIVSALCGAAAALVGVADIVNLNNKLADNPFADAVSVGPGLYLLIVAGVAIAIVPPLLSLRRAPAPPVVPQPQAYWPQQPPQPQAYWQPPQQQDYWPPRR